MSNLEVAQGPSTFVRLIAVSIDTLILGAILMAMGGLALFTAFKAPLGLTSNTKYIELYLLLGSLAMLAAQISIYIAWYNHFYRTSGATPGKKAMGLRVVNMHDSTKLLTTRQVILRELIGKQLIGSATMGISFLSIFRKDGRAVHDLISDSKVIKNPSST